MSHVGSPAQRAASVRAANLARAGLVEKTNERRREFVRLRRVGYSVTQAARQLHVSDRTAFRYEAWRREQTRREVA